MAEGKEYTLLSDVLDRHAELGGKNIRNKKASPPPESHMPKPTLKQYKKGYIPRYFVVHYEGKVTEVSAKWMKDNQGDLPNIYYTYGVKWYISNTSQDPIDKDVASPRASDRNRFLVQNIPNPALTDHLGKNWEQFVL